MALSPDTVAREARTLRQMFSLARPDATFREVSVEDAADVVFAQPMSTAAEVAAMVLDSTHDGKRERVKPRSSATLATLVPGLRQLLEPVMRPRESPRRSAI